MVSLVTSCVNFLFHLKRTCNLANLHIDTAWEIVGFKDVKVEKGFYLASVEHIILYSSTIGASLFLSTLKY